MSLLEEELARLRAGEVTFSAFVQATRKNWRAVAHSIVRRWDLPTWTDVEDVEQDLLLAAWTMIDRYDPTRGRSLKDYVVWNAYDKAKKRAHKARGALRHGGKEDRSPSRYERPLTTYERDSEEGTFNPVLDRQQTPAVQLDRAIVNETMFALETLCTEPYEVAVMRAIAAVGAASLSDAAAVLYDDPNVRRVLRLDSEAHAESMVKSAFRRVVDAAAA